jgi:type II secretory ATPase GspE/PulE/Tfp pilus assembly ATPase PilB-like protein
MMRRWSTLVMLIVVVWAAVPLDVFAQAAPAAGQAAPVAAAKAAGQAAAAGGLSDGWSGPGYYFNVFKILGSWIVFLFWTGTTDWVSRDAQEVRMDYLRWNPLMVGSFLAVFVIHWFVPMYFIGLPLILIAWIAPLTSYILIRNKGVEQHERVMTPEHLRYWFATHASSFGIKMEAERRDPNETGVPLTLAAFGGATERDNAARLLAARQTTGLFSARRLIADALYRRADAVMLDYAQESVEVRFLVDGLWQNAEPLDRETGDSLLESLKTLSGLNPQERQKRQEGKFLAEYFVFKPLVFSAIERAKVEEKGRLVLRLTKEMAGDEAIANPVEFQQRVSLEADRLIREKFATPIGTWTPVEKEDLAKLEGVDRIVPENSVDAMKCVGSIASQGAPTGERVAIQLEVKKTRFKTFDEIGMRSKIQEQMASLLGEDTGICVFSAQPAQGLRTTMSVVLRNADRFVREFMSIEDEGNRYEAIENVPVTTYKGAAGESPVTVLPTVLHQEPQVLVVRDLINVDSARILLEQAASKRSVVTSIRAKDSIDAIQRILAMGVQPSELAPAVRAVFSQRLVRRLCETCKEAYNPPPQVLSQMGLPQGRVQAFYRPPQQREEVCPECGGIGYLGRTAIFEVLVVDDNVRKAIAANARPEAILDAARRAGMRTLQEEGILLVVKGVTSMQELIRVLKT